MHSFPNPASTTRRHPRDAARKRLEALAWLLDSALRVPGTNVRVGFDAILNVVPGVGTLTAKALAAYLILEARSLGVPPATLARMVGHVGVDFLISIVPLFGWVGDVFYRANQRNMTLLREHLDRLDAGHVQAPRGGFSHRGPVLDLTPVRMGQGGR
jgi:hypothetical protein